MGEKGVCPFYQACQEFHKVNNEIETCGILKHDIKRSLIFLHNKIEDNGNSIEFAIHLMDNICLLCNTCDPYEIE
ncbi:hypothetical protein A3Q56_03994 [Intoshia linei]|uniref:Uncharacterized protein n=1 Tax=Intoshia linei TaxID=1819745 RepID=A0A177B209_9BILA|nr:hypothetical protein A3Q56_03994 [Intoshia linei]